MRDKLIKLGTSIPFFDALVYLAIEKFAHRGHDSEFSVIGAEEIDTQLSERVWKIKIAAPRNPSYKNWGDYYFSNEIKTAIQALGENAQILLRGDKAKFKHGDINLVIRGLFPVKPVKNAVNILWIISHPEQISHREIKKFDLIFCASPSWAIEKSKEISREIFPLLQATNPSNFHPHNKESSSEKSGIIFVGNSVNRERQIIREFLKLGYKIRVYGSGWKNKIPSEMIIKESVSTEEVADIYRNSKIVLSDHWPDMRNHGFISNRVFDAVASGAVVLSDFVEGIDHLFEKKVFQYKEISEIKNIISAIDSLPIQDSLERIEFGWEFGSAHSFTARAKKLVDAVRAFDLRN